MSTVRQLLEVKGRDIWSVSPNATVLQALRTMADKQVGALVVLDGDKLVGVLSERDYARKVILYGKTSKATKVKEIMSSPVVTVHPDQTVAECMELMTNKHIRHLPVMENDALIGVISIGDVVRDVIYSQRRKLKDLEERVIRGRETPG